MNKVVLSILILSIFVSEILMIQDAYAGLEEKWKAISSIDAPVARNLYKHNSIVSDNQIIIFGGANSEWIPFHDGGIFSLDKNSWQKIHPLPDQRDSYSMGWANNKLLVWGGTDKDWNMLNSGWVYDSKIEKWNPLPLDQAPSPRYLTAAYAFKKKIIIWGGHPNCDKVDGAILDIDKLIWAPIPPAPKSITAGCSNQYWTGKNLIVWGGFNENENATFSGGAVFNPESNIWVEINSVGAPTERISPILIANDHTLLVWGGRAKNDYQNKNPFHDGAIYRFATKTWHKVQDLTNSLPTLDPNGIFLSDKEIFIWGGPKTVYVQGSDVNSGGILNTDKLSWELIATQNAPSARVPNIVGDIALNPLIWGGNCLHDGAIFDRTIKEWTSVSVSNLPMPRKFSAQIWTGKSIFIWGGQNCNGNEQALGDGYILDL